MTPQPTVSDPLRTAMHQIPAAPHHPEHPRERGAEAGAPRLPHRRGGGTPAGAQGSAGAERGPRRGASPMPCGEPKLPCPVLPSGSVGGKRLFQCRGETGSSGKESARAVFVFSSLLFSREESHLAHCGRIAFALSSRPPCQPGEGESCAGVCGGRARAGGRQWRC